MSSAPLVLSQAVASPSPNGEGIGVNNASNSDVSTGIQGDSNSFPLIMKRIAPNEKAQVTDSLLTTGLTPDGQVPPPQDGAVALPPPGMFLPFIVAQGLASDRVRLEGNPSTGSAAGLAGGDGIDMAAAANFGAAKQAKDKLVPSLSDTQTGVNEENSNSILSATDISSRYAQLTNAVVFGSHETHSAIQTLMNDFGAISDQHKGAGMGLHAGLDAASTNIATNPLLQASDKIATNTATTSIAVPLRHPEWSDELSNRVTWMIRQDVQSANVKINPPHLGPLEVKVSVMNDQVNVSFSSHHAPVREALDASIPRLREMLGDNGLQLGDANVSHRSFSDQNQTSQQSFSQSNHANGAFDINSSGENTEGVRPGPVYLSASAAIDIYA
jgi:hypothetical protein